MSKDAFEDWLSEWVGTSMELTVAESRIARAAWKAATQAERARCSKIAADQVFDDHIDCDGCITAREITANICKGE